jgi:hypothetical protein
VVAVAVTRACKSPALQVAQLAAQRTIGTLGTCTSSSLGSMSERGIAGREQDRRERQLAQSTCKGLAKGADTQ